MNKFKRAFTIVELVIVIAVIAILAGVLIPTFSQVVAQANQSAALQTARNSLNNALSMTTTATLASQDKAGNYRTMFVVDGYVFGYSNGQLVQIDHPIASTTFLRTEELGGLTNRNSYNTLFIYSKNLKLKTGTEGTNGSTYTLDDAVAKIVFSYQDKTNEYGCTTIEANTPIYYYNGHYYLGGTYVAAATNVEESFSGALCEIYLNPDLPKNLVVFTTLG